MKLLLGRISSTANSTICALSNVYSLPCNNFVQKVVSEVKKLIVMALKDLYVSLVLFKKTIDILQAAHQALGVCFHMVFLRFTPPLRNYSLSTSNGIDSFLLSLRVERQQENGVLGLGGKR
jgi:hypothetical protein